MFNSHCCFLTLALLFLSEVRGLNILNINMTDRDTDLDACYKASLDPMYYKHPDKFLKAPEIIRRHGFPVELHYVVSEDGYILELHRIPHCDKFPPGKGHKLPVVVQHGIMASSVNWILPPVEKALAYRLANMGYDVWLSNVRGSSYSKDHLVMDHRKKDYWNFSGNDDSQFGSWHEMGYYDIPAIIDYILDTTNNTKLTYIGHSMGSTMFFVCMSMRPEYNEKVEMMFALAPVAYAGHSTSFFKLFAPFAYNLQRFYERLGTGEFIPESFMEYASPVAASSCSLSAVINCNICNNLYFYLFNSDGRQMNYTMLPVITQHFPDRVSMKTMTHYGQNLVSQSFQQFDERIVWPNWSVKPYVAPGKKPLKYDIKKITAPVIFFWAERDNLANPIDVDRLAKELPNLKLSVKVCYPLFNHNDFLFGMDVNELVYDKLIKILTGDYDVDPYCKQKYACHDKPTYRP